MRDMLLSRRRRDIMSRTWKNLSEDEQKAEIAAFTEMAETTVTAAVDMIAQAGHSVIHATLTKFTIKDGTVQLVAEGIAEDETLLALNRVGKHAIKISVADTGKFDQHRDKIFTNPDTQDLFSDPPQEGSGEMSEDDIDDTAEEMDSELDRMDASDADQLQPEPTDPSTLSPKARGYSDRLNGAGPDENPYDSDEDMAAWAEGYDSANAEVEKINADGRAGADSGARNPWPKGGAAAVIWQEAFSVRMVEIENDATPIRLQCVQCQREENQQSSP